jgi:hypothetical protein
MPNASVISVPTMKPRELNQGGTSTSETQFTVDGTNGYYVILPSGSQLKNRPFKVFAAGRVTGGTTTNFTISLDYGVSTTIASNTTVEASTARAVNSAAHNWMISVEVMWDSTSDKLQGRGWSMVGNLVDAYAAIDTAVTSADPELGTTVQGFTLTGLFSSGNAGNLAYVDVFQIEEI